MRAWVIAAVLTLTAAPALAQATPVPAPAPDGAVTVAAGQNGGSVDAGIGEAVAIQLQRTPSVGTSWSVAAHPDFLSDPQELSGPTVTSSRPIMGAPVWQVFVFSQIATGAGEVTLEKKDRTGAVIETFTVTVRTVVATPAQ